jgi:Protein of unknown function (DUF1761)
MEMQGHFNVLAYIVAGIVYFLIGWLWYSPVLFVKPWSRETGVQMGGKKNPLLPMLGQLVSTFLFTLGVYMVVMLGHFATFGGALVAGLSITVFFVLPINSGSLFFKSKAVLFWIEAGYQTVGSIVCALILALWK